MENTLSFSLLCLIGNLCLCCMSSFHFHLPAIRFSAGSCSLLVGGETLGKQNVQFRVLFIFPWFFIIRFPEHSYIVSKDFSWKWIPRVTLSQCLSLFLFPFQHNSFDIFHIFFGVLMYLFLLPHFIMLLSDLKHFFPTYPSFCPLYPLIYPKPEPWVSAKTPKFRVKGILFPHLSAGIFRGPRVQISECLLSKTDNLQPHSNPERAYSRVFVSTLC